MKIKTREIILVALFSALMAVGAFIKIPFPFVSLTFQPFFCAFAGIILGSRLGMLSQLIYVAVGLIGAPIFTLGGGPMYIFKPSFGYLIGFIVAAYVIGKVSENSKTFKFHSILISLISGLLIIYLTGVPYSYLISRFYLDNQSITLWYVAINSLMFFLKDLALYIAASIISGKLIPILRNAGLFDR